MKEKIIISNKPFGNSRQFGKCYFDAINYYEDKNLLCFLDGYVTKNKFQVQDIARIYREEGAEAINKLEGTYNIIIYDKNEDMLYMSNDRYAPLSLYIYHDEKDTIVSTNFWHVINILSPGRDMLNLDQVYMFSMFGHCIGIDTIIRNMKILEYGSNCIIDFKTNVRKDNKYSDFSDWKEQEMTLDEAADKFYESIVSCRDFLKQKHPNKRFAISVSGGLDSRVLPGLFGVKNEYFVIVGNSRPKRWMKPININYIDKIARSYGIEIKKINQADTSVDRKIFLEMRNPMRHENFIKTIDKGFIDSEILVNAGAPDLLSSSRTMYKQGWSIRDLATKYEGHIYIKKSMKKNIKALFKYIFINRNNAWNIKQTDDDLELFYPIKKETMNVVYERIFNYIDEFTKEKEDPQNAILIYRYENGIDSSLGSFESITGQVKEAYTMFYPFAFNVLKNIPFRYIENRLILKRLIERHFPNVADIESEHSIHGIHDEKRISSLRIIGALIRRVLGGVSSVIMQKSQHDDFLRAFDDANSSWYEELFDNQMVRKVIDIQEDIFMTHLKLKLILSATERKEWKKYIEE